MTTNFVVMDTATDDYLCIRTSNRHRNGFNFMWTGDILEAARFTSEMAEEFVKSFQHRFGNENRNRFAVIEDESGCKKLKPVSA